MLCVLLCFSLLTVLFLTYETEKMDQTQSMTPLTLILDHLQDFRDRAIVWV